VRSLSIVQSASLLKLGAALRAQVGALYGYRPGRVTVNKEHLLKVDAQWATYGLE